MRGVDIAMCLAATFRVHCSIHNRGFILGEQITGSCIFQFSRDCSFNTLEPHDL